MPYKDLKKQGQKVKKTEQQETKADEEAQEVMTWRDDPEQRSTSTNCES